MSELHSDGRPSKDTAADGGDFAGFWSFAWKHILSCRYLKHRDKLVGDTQLHRKDDLERPCIPPTS